VVVDGKWWKTRWLSSSVNSRAALLVLLLLAWLPLLEAPAPAACFGLGCFDLWALPLVSSRKHRARLNKATAKLFVHRSFRPFLCVSLHVTLQATLHHCLLCDYHRYKPTTTSLVHAAVLSLHCKTMPSHQSNVASGTHGSLTLTASHAGPTTLRLRAEAEPSERRRIQWAEDVVDNEGMGKKSSKGVFTSTLCLRLRLLTRDNSMLHLPQTTRGW
jgi:hypothetical protein